MRARIISENHEYYGTEFSVSFLSYDMAAGTQGKANDVIAAAFEDIEFIYDAGWEEKIIKNREILTIKRPKDSSYFMYSAIVQSIEGHIGEKLKELIIIEDRDNSLKNAWMKRVTVLANERPVVINITGKRLSNSFSITASDIEKEEFIDGCEKEVNKVKSGLKVYTKRLNGLMYTIQSIKNNNLNTNSTELVQIVGA